VNKETGSDHKKRMAIAYLVQRRGRKDEDDGAPQKLADGGLAGEIANRGTIASHNMGRPEHANMKMGRTPTVAPYSDVTPKTFALGGLVEKILEKKLNERSRDSRPEGDESIDNFGYEEHPDNDFLSDEEDTEYAHLNIFDYHEPDAELRRKETIKNSLRSAWKDKR
jgi:hypothetical protein